MCHAGQPRAASPSASPPGAAGPAAPDALTGGRPTRAFPDCCAVGDAYYYYCSGTLIAPDVVLTARHCHDAARVSLRGHDPRHPAGGETIWVARQIKHEDPRVDLSLLILERPWAIRPRRVAQGAAARATRAVVVGFGRVPGAPSGPGVENHAGDTGGAARLGTKRRVDVPIASAGCDLPGEAEAYGCLPGFELVAGGWGLNRDSALGDSGGPLYVSGPGGRYVLLGVTSRGVYPAGGASPAPPVRADELNRLRHPYRLYGDGGIYVRADRFLDWIRDRTDGRFAGRPAAGYGRNW